MTTSATLCQGGYTTLPWGPWIKTPGAPYGHGGGDVRGGGVASASESTAATLQLVPQHYQQQLSMQVVAHACSTGAGTSPLRDAFCTVVCQQLEPSLVCGSSRHVLEATAQGIIIACSKLLMCAHAGATHVVCRITCALATLAISSCRWWFTTHWCSGGQQWLLSDFALGHLRAQPVSSQQRHFMPPASAVRPLRQQHSILAVCPALRAQHYTAGSLQC
jgi:hypothetical protein